MNNNKKKIGFLFNIILALLAICGFLRATAAFSDENQQILLR